jgi:hypothetical protein
MRQALNDHAERISDEQDVSPSFVQEPRKSRVVRGDRDDLFVAGLHSTHGRRGQLTGRLLHACSAEI